MDYFQWNNYAKFYNPLGNAHLYVMPGVRLEYLFKSSPTVFLPVSADFPKFWFSGDVGLGYEFPIFKKFSFPPLDGARMGRIKIFI